MQQVKTDILFNIKKSSNSCEWYLYISANLHTEEHKYDTNVFLICIIYEY